MTQFTSKAIEESFIRLLNERPLDKITIKDIVDDCGISRNTFYYHFQDITALLEHILNADVERVLSQHLDMDSWEDGFISAARFALENKRLVYHIYNSVSRERVERYLYSIAGEVMRLYVSRITEQVEQESSNRHDESYCSGYPHTTGYSASPTRRPDHKRNEIGRASCRERV